MPEAIMPDYSFHRVIDFVETDWVSVEGVLRAPVPAAARKDILKALNQYVAFSSAHAVSATKAEQSVILNRLLSAGSSFQKALGDLLLMLLTDEGGAQLRVLKQDAEEAEDPQTKARIAEIIRLNRRNFASIAIKKTKDTRHTIHTRVYERAAEALARVSADRSFLLDLYESIAYLRLAIRRAEDNLHAKVGAGGDPYLLDLLDQLLTIHRGIKADNYKVCDRISFICSILSILGLKNQRTETDDGIINTVPVSHLFKLCCSDKKYLESRLEEIRKMRKDRPTGPLSTHGWTYEASPDCDFHW